MAPVKTIHPQTDWTPLLRRLKRQKAVLLLGPEVIMAGRKDQKPLKEALQAFIHKDLEGRIDEAELKRIQYYSEDGFCFYEDNYKTEVVDAILAFYEELHLTDLYRKVAQLPFHCILSLSPDYLLCDAFKELGLAYHFHYYNKKQWDAKEDDKLLDFTPSMHNRLIYNLFGSIEQEDSLIVSYEDLFTFLEKVFNNHKLPKTVRDTLLDANCFVFVGFNYGKWYLKLLLRMLNIHDKVRKKYGMDLPARPTVETFFVNEFDMNFTGVGTADFIEELFRICQEQDLLVTPEKAKTSLPVVLQEILETARKAIAAGNPDNAFEALLNHTGKQDLSETFRDTLLGLSGQWQQLKKENTLEGIIRYDDFKVESNKITKALLALLTQYQSK